MATGAEPPALAGKRNEEFMPAIGVRAAHPGESFVQISASQVFLDHFVHHKWLRLVKTSCMFIN